MGGRRIVYILIHLAFYNYFVARAVGSCSEDVTKLSNMPLRQLNRLWEKEGDLVISDENLNYEWYRVVHNGWQYIMVDSTNKPNYTSCSTYFPVYLRDTHPTINSLTETPTNVVACKRDYVYPCDIQHQVKIRKCGDEIQYYLPPTKSYSAFCFRNHSKLYITPDVSDVVLGNIGIAPELSFTESPTSSPFGNSTNYDPYFQFRCSFNIQEGFFYKVSWYVNGVLLVSYGPTTDINGLLFHQSVLIDNNIAMGFDIQCGVSALTSEDADAGITEMVFSTSYFAGIKVSSTTVNINKGNTAVLQMTSTMPIGCRYDDALDDGCIENFHIFNKDNEGFQCQAGVANFVPQPNQRCSNGFQTLKNGTIWNPETVFNFSIVTTDINYNDKRLFYLLLQFPDTMGHKIWRNYNFPLVKVIVSDNGEYKNKICYSHIDPHMRTADGSYYEQQRKNGQLFPGVFLLYNNTKYGIEVQQQTKSCNNGRATCACGIAIRAGKDVFMINRCGSINYLGFTKCEDGGILQVVKRHDYMYHVFTPIGTKITIRLFHNEHGGRYGGTMNIDITMAPKDVNNIEGLCGQFDNNPANDFKDRDGIDLTINDFTESWSLTDTEPLNLFLTGNRHLDSWGDLNGMFCICNSTKKVAEATCYPTQYLNCTMSRSITSAKCNVPSKRKRSADGSYKDEKELDRLLKLMASSEHNTPDIKLRTKREDVINNLITEEDAEALCKDKISGSLAVQEYSEVGGNEDPNEVIKQCTFDVVYGNDTSWATAHVESVNNIVKNIIDLEPTYVANNSEKVVIFYKNTCPGNCSNNGACTETSECDCFGFFHGPECDIDERDPLTIDDIEGGGECDLADGDECLCFHVRSSNILEGFKCQANTSKITVTGERELLSTKSFTGGYEDIYTGVCCVQDNVIGTDGVFVTKYDFSVSNNGITYGNDVSVYVFDSTCQEGEFTSFKNASFSLKTGFCFIDGFCAAEKKMAPVGCLACQSMKDKYNWTVYNPCQNGGYCTDETYGYSCFCVDGYGGKNCEIDIDECSSDPCNNGGTCKDLVNGYECTCNAGYDGTTCDNNIDECLSNPCNNGATCTDLVNSYKCTCVSGYDGTDCDNDINECAPDPCKNGGTCKDLVNKYECTCAAGYDGTNCDNNINECSSEPCKNGGTCKDLVNGYECTCAHGYDGDYCNNNINDCLPNPCKNNGECRDGLNMFTCNCSPGFEGTECEIDINECIPNPCKNGGSCQDRVNGYTCTCVAGFHGVNCSTDINECLNNPCENNGRCEDKVNGWICHCIDGYDGANCEIDINECSSNPCMNGGSCKDLDNKYDCTCAPGYEGPDCENEINECSSNPCNNGGSCINLINKFECECVAGYDGTTCDNDINECLSYPCKNGGICKDLINKYECTCVAGYDGSTCENDINECSSNPCKNGASCIDRVNGYECICTPGYDGIVCDNDINYCSPDPCKNGGTCDDLVNSYECRCADGYDGNNCDNNINECSSNPCMNGATCYDLVNGYKCTCVPGYDGNNCENDINDCSSDPCKNEGTCKDFVNRYECTCAAGYDGSNCDNDINECSSNPCSNGGMCKDLINGYECTCDQGYDGTHCENNVDECYSNPCKNGGTCKDLINGYECTCVVGYDGSDCSNDINECSSNPCKNNGECRDGINMFTCSCSLGFEGTECEININECIPNPCKNHGSCQDRVNGYTCTCVAGFFGVNCSTDINECLSNPCENEGTCEDKVNGRICHCIDGYEGTNCEIDVNECLSNPCKNGGTCKDLVNKYECTCVPGYNGPNCDIDINECLSNPCKNGGACKDLVNKYECTCVPGYNGPNCDIDINECLNNPCKNGGTCKDLVNKYECTCAAGYNGPNCNIDINECSGNPCKNGGACKDLVNKYECTCVVGYSGPNCDIDINDCSSNPCKNGGSCKDLVNEYECTCVAGYDGMNCDNDVNECSSNPCKNGGTCKDLVNKYECACVAGYNGPNCDIDINECSSNPCKNAGICKDFVNEYECTCVAGYDGMNCENDINECLSNPCKNGGACKDIVNKYECTCVDINECSSNPCKNAGICKDLVNEYECTCVAGYDGMNCENDINECSPDPCKKGGTCKDLVNEYKCTCAAGYNGKNCDINVNECSPNPCKNGATCKDLVNGYKCTCVAGYDGTDCENEIKTTTKSPNQKLARASVTMIFPVQSNFNVTDSKLKDDVKNQLMTIYRDNMGETLIDLVIKSISKGSLVVDFELIYANDTSAASTKITEVNIALLSGREIIQVFNETVSATSLKLNDVTVTNTSLSDDRYICKMFEALSGMCPSNQHCSIVDRQPSCVFNEADESTNSMLVIVVVVCAIAAPIVILLVICLTIRKLRNSNKLNHNNGTDKSHPGCKWSDHNFMGSYGNRLSGRSFKPDSNFPEHDYY